MLQSDSQGFLIGEVLDVSKALLDGQKSGLETLGRIDSNLAALVNRRMRSNTVRSFVPEAAPVEPVGRRSSVQVGPFGQPIPRTSSPRSSPASSSSKAVASVSTPALSNRDARGRFVKRGGLGPDDERAPGGGSSPDRASSGGDSRIVEAIKEAVKESSDRMDPMVEAAKEVWEPLGRTWRASFGQSAEKKKEGWYKRIIKAITGNKPDKASTSVSTVVSGGGGGMLGGLGAVLGGAGGMLSRGGRGLMSGAGALFKRLPIVGALLSGAGVLASLSRSDDPSLSNDENRKKRYRGVGESVGMGVGGAAGAAIGSLLGPAGTIAGGYLGAMLGEKVGAAMGEWTKSLVDADVPGKIASAASAAFAKISELASAAFNKAKDVAKETVNVAKSAANGANDSIKSVTGVDVKKTVSAAATASVQAAKNGAKAAGEFVADNASKLVPETVKNVSSWVLGRSVKKFESGSAGAGAVSTGKGDFGGASYGTYQMSSKRGVVQNFLREKGYASQFQGLAPGSPEFNAKWKELAAKDPSFAEAQHSFIKQTHYDPQVRFLKKEGLDLSGRGSAVQDSIWSTSVQFGGYNTVIKNALRGKDLSKLSDAEIVSAIQDYKIKNNESLFAKSSDAVRAGTLSRAVAEKSVLVAQAGKLPSASVAVPKVGNIPALEQPPALSYRSDEKAPVVLKDRTVGQNVEDRAIAHIVTGGMGGG